MTSRLEWRSLPGRWMVRGRRGGKGRRARGDGDRIRALSGKGEQEERRAEPRVSQIPVAPLRRRRRPSTGGSSVTDAGGIEERLRWNWERRWWREGRVVVFGQVWRGWGRPRRWKRKPWWNSESHRGRALTVGRHRAAEQGILGTGRDAAEQGFWMGGGSVTVSRDETPGAVVVRRPVDRDRGVFSSSLAVEGSWTATMVAPTVRAKMRRDPTEVRKTTRMVRRTRAPRISQPEKM